MRKVILYIAMSLDGYIAGPDDDLSFLNAFDHLDLVKSSYEDLLSHIDTILLGRKTYDWIVNHSPWPYQGLVTYVFSSKPYDIPHGMMTNENPKTFVSHLKNQTGKGIWLIGGGVLVQSLLDDHLVDEMVIAITPHLLGGGTKLFGNHQLEFDLTDVKHEENLILVTYQKKAV
jgi:dihydrofolate reductase